MEYAYDITVGRVNDTSSDNRYVTNLVVIDTLDMHRVVGGCRNDTNIGTCQPNVGTTIDKGLTKFLLVLGCTVDKVHALMIRVLLAVRLLLGSPRASLGDIM